MKHPILIVFLLVGIISYGQEDRVLDRLVHDVSVLADDTIEGREIGTMGELLAAKFRARVRNSTVHC